jgi:hypothetical protein
MIYLALLLELLTKRVRSNIVNLVEDGNLGRLIRAHWYSIVKAKHKFNRRSTVYSRSGRVTHNGDWYDLQTGTYATI